MKFEIEQTFSKRGPETEAYMKEQLGFSFAENPERAVAQNPEVQEAFTRVFNSEQSESTLDSVEELVREINPSLAGEVVDLQDRLHAESEESEHQLEIAKLKAEINELNKTVQSSEVMSRFGSNHGFNKEEAYSFVENRILENEKRIRELEQNGKEKTLGDLKAWHGYARSEDAQNAVRRIPEVAWGAEKVESGGRNWWGWIKERAKGFVTLGFWEFHQAERFKSNKKEVARGLAESAESIRKTKNLSLEDALNEAQTMTLLANVGGVERPGTEDYEKFSRAITEQKIEENGRYIETLISQSSNELKRRLKKYRDEFGEVVVSDKEIMSNFEEDLRRSLLDLQDGQRSADTKKFNELITKKLDPKYWRRYLYGTAEMILASLGLNAIIGNLSASQWWLGKKAAEEGVGNIVNSAQGSVESGTGRTFFESQSFIDYLGERGVDLGGTTPDAVVEAVDPEVLDEIQMQDTIWRTAKEWLQQNGVGSPTDSEIMEVSKQVAKDNGIGVKIWNIPGEPLDTGMQQGHLLKFSGASKILTAIRITRGIASVI